MVNPSRSLQQKQLTPNDQSCRYRFGTHFGLVIRMRYFGTGQYRRSVSDLPQIYIYIYIYIDLLLYKFIHQNL